MSKKGILIAWLNNYRVMVGCTLSYAIFLIESDRIRKSPVIFYGVNEEIEVFI